MPAAVASQEKRNERRTPASPMRRRARGSPRTARSPVGVVAGIVALDEMTVTPSSTTYRRPPTADATTGVAHACASSATSPKDSDLEGTSTASAAA